MEPESVSVIIHNARNLQGRKKGKHKFNVIFGIGNKRFKTDNVSDPVGCPTWNEESTVPVEDKNLPLLMVVYDGDVVLGQVSLALNTLPTSQPSWSVSMPLQAHRKCSQPHGDLTYRCWVSKVRARVQPTIKVGGEKPSAFERLKDSLFSRGSQSLKKAFSSGSVALLNKKNSQSNEYLSQETTNMQSQPRQEPVRPISYTQTAGMGGGGRARSTSHLLADMPQASRPEVTGVTPNEGPASGFTKLTIRGYHLGHNREDVIGLTVCGANCLSSLEYESPQRLHCTTKPWQECNGEVVVTTRSGGRGLSLARFRFVDDSHYNSDNMSEDDEADPFRDDFPVRGNEHTLGVSARSEGGDSLRSNSTLSSAAGKSREEMLALEVARLQRENENIIRMNTRLKEDNDNMRAYVDDLLAKVLGKYPDLLEVTAATRMPQPTSDEFTMQL